MPVCDYCGGEVPVRGKAPHFRGKHPQFKFHLARSADGRRTLIICDVCGHSVETYKGLCRRHKHERDIQRGPQEAVESKAAKLATLVSKGECVCGFSAPRRTSGAHRTKCDRWLAEIREAMPEIIEEAKARGLDPTAYRYSMGRDTLCLILHRRGMKSLTPAVVARQHAYLEAAQRYDPQPAIQPAATTIVALTESMLQRGRDPRIELWEAIFETIGQQKARIAALEGRVTQAEAEAVRLRLEKATLESTNNGLRAQLEQLHRTIDEGERMKIMEQARTAVASPGEGSLVERP